MPYVLPPRIRRFFQQFVNRPYEQHERTKAWVREVVRTDWSYHSGTIAGQGRASFLDDKNGLTPEDQIIVYCYYYMQMHAVSGFHLFQRARKDHNIRFLRNTLFIDFGCGPLTSAVSLAWHNMAVNSSTEDDGMLIHYIGIDRSPAMLSHARKATQTDNLFHKDSRFAFVDRRKDVPAHLEACRSSLNKGEIKIILNFSYFFGSTSLNVPTLTDFVTELLRDHFAKDKVCLAFQNPWYHGANTKWEQFKAGIKKHLSEVSDVPETIHYQDVTGQCRNRCNPIPIRLRRELLLNRNRKDQL